MRDKSITIAVALLAASGSAHADDDLANLVTCYNEARLLVSGTFNYSWQNRNPITGKIRAGAWDVFIELDDDEAIHFFRLKDGKQHLLSVYVGARMEDGHVYNYVADPRDGSLHAQEEIVSCFKRGDDYHIEERMSLASHFRNKAGDTFDGRAEVIFSSKGRIFTGYSRPEGSDEEWTWQSSIVASPIEESDK